MARCTAPVYGHRSASAAAACPACGGRYGGYRDSYGYGGGYSSSYPSAGASSYSGGGRSTGGGSSRPRWSRAGSFEAAGVKVWFSEKDLGLGVPMMRAIDKGLAASKIGLVLVTPALLARLRKEGVADKELSTLLQGNRLVPIVHGTTYAALREVSPMLASRSGLDTSEDSMTVIASKIAELVTIWS